MTQHSAGPVYPSDYVRRMVEQGQAVPEGPKDKDPAPKKRDRRARGEKKDEPEGKD